MRFARWRGKGLDPFRTVATTIGNNHSVGGEGKARHDTREPRSRAGWLASRSATALGLGRVAVTIAAMARHLQQDHAEDLRERARIARKDVMDAIEHLLPSSVC